MAKQHWTDTVKKTRTRQEQMRTEAFKGYKEWRNVLHQRINNRNELPLMQRPDADRELLAINRQVALAIISDLEYNFRKRKEEIHMLTGKSPVYWNFQILGTTSTVENGRKVREEQKTSDYFMATTLNALHDNGVELDWGKLGFTLEQARWRVIAEPADVEKREQWRLQCGGECVEPGINYPAPWHVSNWAGEQALGTEDLLILGFSGYKETTVNPGRIKRLDIACFGPDGNPAPEIQGQGKLTRRPSILKGLGRRTLKKQDVVGAEFEELLEKTMRKVHPMLDQEIDRRMKAERKVRELEQEIFVLQAQMSNLEQENEAMLERGKKYREALDKINKLSWTKGIK